MKKTAKLLIFLSLLFLLVMPLFSFAQTPAPAAGSGGLVPCGTSVNTNPCGFQDFMKLINNVITFIFTFLAVPICALMFAYAGALMVTSGGSSESKSKAKKIFTNALIGLALAAGAWIIVKSLLSILGYKDIGLFF